MIDYKTTPPPTATGNETLLEHVSSANSENSISLTWLWEIIVRTRRLPDNLDATVLFLVLRDRLRNPEREVRQNALCVLADLIPVVDRNNLDNYMEVLFQDLIVNLSYTAPAVRKGAIDVVRIHLKHSLQPNEILKKFLTAIPTDNHLILGLILATPYLVNIDGINREMLMFVLQQLTEGMKQEFLREASLNSLVKIRKKLGSEQFDSLLNPEIVREFEEICKQENLVLEPTINDNVILETEIMLDTGPAITMKIHEESTKTPTNLSDSDDDYRKHRPFIRMLTDDSETEMSNRSPRKVRFGGEVVKMRTPESDSNQPSDDNDVQTSLIIDRPTSIKITLSDRVAAIKTRHKSMIPVRITTGSYPTSPVKESIGNQRLHRSAPELRKIQKSRIPLRNRQRIDKKEKNSKIDRITPPTHREVEMLHNLARSPVPNQETEMVFNSFQVYEDELKKEAQIFDRLIDNLQQKDIRIKSRNLDDLVANLQENPQMVTHNNIDQLLQALFSCESNYRLQNRVHEALQLIIATTNPKILSNSMRLFSNNLVQFESSQSVRLSLQLMEKTSPHSFFDSLTINEPKERILQILIASTRIFPSSNNIDFRQGVQLAFDCMKDPRRAVKQAALEALASLAQIAGNSRILEIIDNIAKDEEDYQNFLRIIRTRLSRKQLPMVDIDGNIRYSSPKEPEELDWLCGGVISIRKTNSLNSIKLPTNNYWKYNSRHELDLDMNVEEPSNTTSKERIWTIDGTSFPKLDNIGQKVSLYPVYVLEETNQKSNDRRRSTSPPKNRRNDTKHRRSFRYNDQFRKSLSSEQIYNTNNNNGNNRLNEQTSYSLSSRSSTTSTGSSTKNSGVWFKSSIPIPINTNDTKLKLRYNRNHSDNYSGPIIAQETFNRTKLESAENSPTFNRDSHQQSPSPQPPPPPPPRSSGSESSGYFTPPPDHHLKDQVLERYISQDTFEEINNNPPLTEPNFQVIIDSETENQDVAFVRQSSGSSIALSEEPDKNEIQTDEVDHQEPLPNTPISQFDFNENPRNFEQRSKSRSEGNINRILPDIERKTINSAPPLNEVINFNVVPYRYPETPPQQQQTLPVQPSLPGSVALSDQSPAKQSDDDTPKRLNRRSIYSRGSLKRSLSSQPLEVRPYSRPKEALQQGLNQMNNSDWEITMQGLNCLIRLAQHHPEILEGQIHAICNALAKNIKNLRSQVARTACRAASEVFATSRKALDMELEELAGPLLQRTADTNKFLRSDANAALDIMSLNMSVPRVVAVITHKGSTHQNCIVRAAATRLLSDIAGRIGCEKIYQFPKETREKFFIVGANGLAEGSLESRKYAKTLMSILYKHPHFHKVLIESVPPHTIRHIAKTLNSLK